MLNQYEIKVTPKSGSDDNLEASTANCEWRKRRDEAIQLP